MNKVTLSGYIANDIELKSTQNGISVTKFNLAVKRPRAKEDTTDFIPIVCWRHTAEFVCKYFSKGDGVEVSGIITIRKYQDRDGNNRYATEVVAEEIDFGKSRKSTSDSQQRNTNSQPMTGNQSQNGTYYEAQFTEVASDEDLPF